ncbi:MAG: AAA family ATPase [Minisyncoccia bacterium]
MIVLGITGHPASGKDTIADYLVTKRFAKYTFGDFLREEMRALNLPLDRASMSKYATDKKRELGNDYLCYV